jgi:hypothetical protein
MSADEEKQLDEIIRDTEMDLDTMNAPATI